MEIRMKIEHMGVGWAELEGTGGRWEAFLPRVPLPQSASS